AEIFLLEAFFFAAFFAGGLSASVVVDQTSVIDAAVSGDVLEADDAEPTRVDERAVRSFAPGGSEAARPTDRSAETALAAAACTANSAPNGSVACATVSPPGTCIGSTNMEACVCFINPIV